MDDIVMYTVKDIKSIFKCGQRQAYELMHTPGFPSIRLNSKLVVEHNSLVCWLKQNEGKRVVL